jgi:NAD(P)H-dependent FMN reductase
MEYCGKPVALCGVSSGVYGGARVITHLQPVLLYLGLIPTREVLNIPNVQNHVQDGVYVADEKMLKRIDVVVSELVLYARRFLAPVEA